MIKLICGNPSLIKVVNNMESIILDQMIINKNRVDYYFIVSKGLKKYLNYNQLFIEYEVDISDIPNSLLIIPFVANIMPLIWITDSILWITDIDRTFYDAIPKIKNAFQEMYPLYKFRGTIIPANTTVNTYEPVKESIQLFSGGVDANTTFIRIKKSNPILINIQGWYKEEVSENPVYDADKRDIIKFSQNNNIHAEFVRSNFATLVNNKEFKRHQRKLGKDWWSGFQHGNAFISIASVLAYKYKVRNIYIASSYTIGYEIAWGSDPRTDILFSFATNGRTIHDGYELTRQQKVKILVEYQKSINKQYPIRVCSFNDSNCCTCEKCFRTILGIIVEGGDISKFSFNIDKNLKDHFQEYFKENIQKFPVKSEQVYWSQIKDNINEVYDKIQEKEFIDWFLNYDFIREHKNAIFRYRVTHIFPILKRKIKSLIS